jgi:hypothetical protein
MRLSSLKRNGVAWYPQHVALPDLCNDDGTAVRVDLYVDVATRRAYQVDARNGRYRVADISRGPSTFGEWRELEAE